MKENLGKVKYEGESSECLKGAKEIETLLCSGGSG